MKPFYLCELEMLSLSIYCFSPCKPNVPEVCRWASIRWMRLKARGGQVLAGKRIVWILAVEMSNRCRLKQNRNAVDRVLSFSCSPFLARELCTFWLWSSKQVRLRAASCAKMWVVIFSSVGKELHKSLKCSFFLLSASKSCCVAKYQILDSYKRNHTVFI